MQPHHQQQNPAGQPNMISPDEAADKQLLELLQMMDSFTPVVPEALTDYLMTKSGVECDDVRLKRLIALIAQKYVTDIANDAMHYSKQRLGNSGTSAGRVGSKKTTLTMEDLSSALADRGINVKRPPYYT